MVGVHLTPFDPTRDFKAQRFFRFDGVIYERGQPFPSGDQRPDQRQFRKLYESRHIGYVESDQMRQIPPVPPKLQNVSDEDRAADLVENNSGAELWAMVEKIESERQIELGVKKSDNKTTLALAIVKAGNGAP